MASARVGGRAGQICDHEDDYCYNRTTCGCQLKVGSEAAMTRTMHVAMGPLPQGRILERHLRSNVSCSVPW